MNSAINDKYNLLDENSIPSSEDSDNKKADLVSHGRE
jgi:hypothetical protein